jgi:hypothetical protein
VLYGAYASSVCPLLLRSQAACFSALLSQYSSSHSAVNYPLAIKIGSQRTCVVSGVSPCTLNAQFNACRHPHIRIEAHKVYNEYIQDKQHIHMNSTKWLTLTDYVKYLGREGFCKVEETQKGWYISVIHRDVEQV